MWPGSGAGTGQPDRQAVPLQPGVELRAGDAEQARGPCAVVPRLPERLGDQVALDDSQIDAPCRREAEVRLEGTGRAGRSIHSDRQVFDGDEASVAQDGRALERVAQL